MKEILNGLHLNNCHKGQASIEFSLAFIIALLFLVLTCRVFVWFSGSLLRRHLAYEGSRVEAGGGAGSTRGKLDFYKSPKLDLFGKETFKK